MTITENRPKTVNTPVGSVTNTLSASAGEPIYATEEPIKELLDYRHDLSVIRRMQMALFDEHIREKLAATAETIESLLSSSEEPLKTTDTLETWHLTAELIQPLLSPSVESKTITHTGETWHPPAGKIQPLMFPVGASMTTGFANLIAHRSGISGVPASWLHFSSYVADSLFELVTLLEEDVLAQEPNLSDALDTLHNIEEQFEEGDIRPPDELVVKVKALVHRLYMSMDRPVPMTIEAMPEGDITLNISPNRYDILFMHCDTDGSVYCMAKLNNKRTTHTYNALESLPNEFIEGVLRRISEQSE